MMGMSTIVCGIKLVLTVLIAQASAQSLPWQIPGCVGWYPFQGNYSDVSGAGLHLTAVSTACRHQLSQRDLWVEAPCVSLHHLGATSPVRHLAHFLRGHRLVPSRFGCVSRMLVPHRVIRTGTAGPFWVGATTGQLTPAQSGIPTLRQAALYHLALTTMTGTLAKLDDSSQAFGPGSTTPSDTTGLAGWIFSSTGHCLHRVSCRRQQTQCLVGHSLLVGGVGAAVMHLSGSPVF